MVLLCRVYEELSSAALQTPQKQLLLYICIKNTHCFSKIICLIFFRNDCRIRYCLVTLQPFRKSTQMGLQHTDHLRSQTPSAESSLKFCHDHHIRIFKQQPTLFRFDWYFNLCDIVIEIVNDCFVDTRFIRIPRQRESLLIGISKDFFISARQLIPTAFTESPQIFSGGFGMQSSF